MVLEAAIVHPVVLRFVEESIPLHKVKLSLVSVVIVANFSVFHYLSLLSVALVVLVMLEFGFPSIGVAILLSLGIDVVAIININLS